MIFIYPFVIGGIAESLNEIVGGFQLLLDYIANAFKAVVFAIDTAIEALPVVLKVSGVMPWVITAGVITTIVIFVIRAIFGR